MPTATLPPAASRYYAASAAAAVSAQRAARAVQSKGPQAIWNILALFQIAQAQIAQDAVGIMLDQQEIDAAADALLNSEAFTTSLSTFEAMLDQIETDWQFDQLVGSLVQDSGRAAQGVAVAARPNIGHIRMLNPPSCSRCVVLAGRFYRYSTGFLRHPGDDCVMIPTTVANRDLVQDPIALMNRGLVTGLSKADQQAIRDGADFNRVVNVRLKKAGMTESGRVLSRRGRLTPEAIYRDAGDDSERALALLQQAGYLL